MMDTSKTNERVFYGRRRGRVLRNLKSGLMEVLLPQLEINLPGSQDAVFPSGFFGNNIQDGDKYKYCLEIGFGGGEHLAERAREQSHVRFVGSEAFINGVASLLEHIDAHKLDNIRIFPKPVQELLSVLAPRTFHGIFILFPDPWPKARHQKRRLVNTAFLEKLSIILAEDGFINLATDDPGYAESMLEAISQSPSLILSAHYTERPFGWPPTRYEQKGLECGRICHYLVVTRRAA